MKVNYSVLPWSGAPVRAIPDARSFLERYLPNGSGDYLPRSIAVFSDPEIGESALSEFLERAARQLERELFHRSSRYPRLTARGLLETAELRSILTGRSAIQPWAIYCSGQGGLGPAAELLPDRRRLRGVVPCSSMRNHGVCWSTSDSGTREIWLATARKQGLDWDWDSDIGHESAHAAFAPVPLFVQPVSNAEATQELAAVRRVGDLEPAHFTRICYLLSELAVVAVRGEPRPTDTRLPVASREELFALLWLCDELVPRLRFDSALTACTRVHGLIDPEQDNEIFEIACPILRIVPHLTPLCQAFDPPDASTFRTLSADAVGALC